MTDSTETTETTLYYTHFNTKNPMWEDADRDRVQRVREILNEKFAMVGVGENGFVFESELSPTDMNFAILNTIRDLDMNTSGFVWFQPMDFVKEQRWLEGDLLDRVNRAKDVFRTNTQVYGSLAKFAV